MTAAYKWRKNVRSSPRMNRNRQYVSQAGLTEARKKGRCRGPDDIDHRPHVGAGLLGVGLPIRHYFVQIQNRLVVTETDLIKERNVASKLFPNKDLVVSPHRNDEIGSLDQLLGELSLDVCGWISALLAQSGLDPGMHRLRLGVDPGRADDAGRVRAKSDFERVLGCHTPKNVPRTHKEDRLKFPARSVLILRHDTPG